MSSHPSFEPLPGPEGQTTPVLRHGDTVLRPAGPWTPTVHALLIHLENAGFSGSPRVVGNGYDGHGREVLTYIPGEFVHPHAWSDEGIWQVGRLLHDLHDATADFQPAPDAVWHRWPFHSDAPDAIISHRDTGPWNIVARDGLPVAFIDWPTAGPTGRLDEIAGMRMLLDHAGLVVEPSAALGIAAILEDRDRFAGRHVVTIVCGSNVDLVSRSGDA